jgi:hypothetical protein
VYMEGRFMGGRSKESESSHVVADVFALDVTDLVEEG